MRRFNIKMRELILTCVVICFSMVLLMPAIVALSTSLKVDEEIFTKTPSLIPHNISFATYDRLLSIPEFPTYLLNSLIVGSLTALISIIAAVLAAYALVFLRFKGRTLISQTILLVYMFPAITLVIPMFYVADTTGLLDSYLILILSNLSFSLPIAIWLLVGFLREFPIEIEKAARVDGCSRLQTIRYIILPLMLPALTAVGAFAFILAWGEYLFSITLTVTDAHRTASAGLHSILGNYRIDYGLLTAASVLIVTPVIALFSIFQRYIVEGLSAGSLKS
jgi:multiple sugar transport system permease protein